MGQALALLRQYGAEGVALEGGDGIGAELLTLGHRGVDDVDQPVGAVQPAPRDSRSPDRRG